MYDKQVDLENTKSRIEKGKDELETYEIALEKAKETATIYANKEIKIENESCSVCGQKLPENKIKETLVKLKEKQASDIEYFKIQISDLENKIDVIKSSIEKDKKTIENIEKEMKLIETKEYENVEETEKQKELRVRKEELELKNKELNKEFETLKNNLIEEPILKTEEIERVDVYIEELNEINDTLATTITLEKLESDIKNKEDDLKGKRESKQLNYTKMQEIIAFNNAKAELLKQRVRKYFKIVEFITSETTNDGNLVETFKLAYNEIPYEDLNQSMKILVCLDLLVGIQKIKDKHICILIDNGEQITRLPELDTQLIVTYVKKQEIKKVEVK